MPLVSAKRGNDTTILEKILIFLCRFGPIRRLLSKITINQFAYAAPLRPRPYSMAADYTTWSGLTNRSFSGRHLPRAQGAHAPSEPDLEEVAALFVRKEFRPAYDSNLLFAFFAQWFTDGFLRTKWEETSPRQFKENESNHEIDANQIYGTSERQTEMLRDPAHRHRLRTQLIDGEEWPEYLFSETDGKLNIKSKFKGIYTKGNFDRVFHFWNDDEKRMAFAVGLEHGNSTIGQAAMNALWFREHNRTADIIKESEPEWDDERVFQAARNVTTVCLLNIVVSDYIVTIAPIPVPLEVVPGHAEGEDWYRTNHIPVEFALLYRWHDLIPDSFALPDRVLDQDEMRRANKALVETGLGATLLAASKEAAGQFGLFNTADFLMVKRSEGGPDVRRTSIEMGRAVGLASFNDYREHFGLSRYRSFEELTQDKEVAKQLRALYKDIDLLEWFVGIFAEGYGTRDLMGKLMLPMVANDAFTQALTNPLLAKAVFTEETFSKAGFKIAQETKTLSQIIRRNTDLADDTVIRFERPEAPTQH